MVEGRGSRTGSAVTSAVAAIVVAGRFASPTKVKPRLSHDFPGCDELAEAFLVGKSVTGTKGSATAPSRRRPEEVLRLVRPVLFFKRDPK